MAMETFHGQQTVPMLLTVLSPSVRTWQSSSRSRYPSSRFHPEQDLESSTP